MRSRKRSSWLSGSGYVPSNSTGFSRGDHHERPRQRMGLAVGRHLPLAHRLQQGALRARRGPVDLVGQHDVGEDRAGTEDELLRLAVVQAAAGDVGGQQVGRELDAMELAGQAAGDGLAHQRLAHARECPPGARVRPASSATTASRTASALPSTTREMFCCKRFDQLLRHRLAWDQYRRTAARWQVAAADSFATRPVAAQMRRRRHPR